MNARLEHDCRVRNIDGAYRAHCNCGWRSDLHTDSSTAWSVAQDHVVMAMNPPESSDFAVAFAERREAEINASLMTRDEWQIDPDLLAAQERVRLAERADKPVQISESAPQTPVSRAEEPTEYVASAKATEGGIPTGAATSADAAPANTRCVLTRDLDWLENLPEWQRRFLDELFAPAHKNEHLEYRFIGRKIGYGFVWVPNDLPEGNRDVNES